MAKFSLPVQLRQSTKNCNIITASAFQFNKFVLPAFPKSCKDNESSSYNTVVFVCLMRPELNFEVIAVAQHERINSISNYLQGINKFHEGDLCLRMS